MKYALTFLMLVLLVGISSFAQVGINSDNSAPDPSAMLEVKSSSKGLLPPRMTQAQRDAVVSPAEGLIVICTDCGIVNPAALSIYINGAWRMLTGYCTTPVSPAAGTHTTTLTSITWNWNPVANATGYKWGTTNSSSAATDMGTATTKTESGLTCNTSYARFIWAYNDCGLSPVTGISKTTSSSSPGNPTAGTHVPGITQITWNWNAVTGATGYKWNTMNNYLTATDMGTSLTKTETGLLCLTSYTRYIWAYGTCGNSTAVAISATTLTNPPVSPTEGTHVPTLTQITWKWNTVAGASGYKWNTSNNYATATNMGTATSKVESGLTCNTPYVRFAWSYSSCGNSTPVTLNQATSANPPAAPVAAAHTRSQTQIVWNWHPVSGATGYKWNTTNSYASATEMGTDTTKTETGLVCDSTYTRYVWAYGSCGNSVSLSLTDSTLACWACGISTLTINHVAGAVAPVTKTTTYGTVTNIPGELTKCWITSNLGSDHQATAVSDATEPSAGWYWQVNRKQGFKHDGTTRTPNTTWMNTINEFSDWITANDPCALLLGNGWRVPTFTEWTNVDATGNWTDWNGPWNSGLRMHAAGYLSVGDGSLNGRGTYGMFWSSTTFDFYNGWLMRLESGNSWIHTNNKAYGFSLRCLRDKLRPDAN